MGKIEQTGRTKPVSFMVYGQPCSKANSRRLVRTPKGKTAFIKSRAALQYVEDFVKQCPALDPMFEGDVHVAIEIHYASRRPDLDESVILDAMQGLIYRNDRQVRRKTVEGFVDGDNPRSLIRVEPYRRRPGRTDK